MKYKILLSIILTLIFQSYVPGQQKNIEKLTPNNIKIVQKKPTFYIEFVRVGKHTIGHPFISSPADDTHLPSPDKFKPQIVDAVWLRLCNNSKWAIKMQFGMDDLPKTVELNKLPSGVIDFVPKSDAELDIVYGVEPINSEGQIPKNLTQNAPFTRFYGTISDLWLLSGHSFVFMVRREELQRNLQIFVPFKYEWEVSKTEKGYGEPQHRVFFDWSDFENATKK